MSVKNDLLKTIESMNENQLDRIADRAFDGKYAGNEKCSGADALFQVLQGQVDYCEYISLLD